ncbi:hypothetical protein CRYUN_Cryun26dG0092000 [Craigia yunnanensis]
MCRVERAIELVHEMKGAGIEPNAKVYNPIIDALGEAGPGISMYNSLVKGYCKARDLFRKIEEAMNLYTKMIQSGHTPDQLTYHLLLKMLFEEERLNLAVQVSKEMRARGYDRDLATSTMLIH